MKVFAFRHVPFEDVGYIRPALESRAISIECVDLYREGASLPDVSEAAGLVFMGGPMSANDDLGYLRQEMNLIRAAHDRELPVLGVCLGSQLIARALGASVYRNPQKEIGWFEITLTPDAEHDAVFSGLDHTLPVFHWHGETFDLPPGAVWLAQSNACRHQAFRVGRSTYGLQFHCEVTPEMIADWCLQDQNCGDVRELNAPIDPFLHNQQQQELSQRLFGKWADLL